MSLFGNRSFLVKMVKETPSGPVEEDVFDDIKTHWEKHKMEYIVGGIGLSAVITTYLVMRGNVPLPNGPRVPLPPNAHSNANNRIAAGLFNWRPTQTLTVTTEISQHRQGPPSWIVKGPDDVLYPSQAIAAVKNGISKTKMSKHLREGLALPDGQQFERVALNVNS